jgi:ELWxxDGT repeat protein
MTPIVRCLAVLLFPIVAVAQAVTPQSSTPLFVADFGGFTYFTATEPAAGRELWRTDGTSEGTTRVTDLVPGTGGVFAFRKLGIVAGKLVLGVTTNDLKQSLYVIGESDAGFQQIASNQQVLRAEGVLYRGALYYVTAGRLWRTDGTSAGTRDTGIAGYRLMAVSVMGDSLYSIAVTDAYRVFLLRTDGTPAGTEVLLAFAGNGHYDTADGATISVLDDDTLVVSIYTESTLQTELYSSDGTAAGTTRIATFDDGFLEVEPLWTMNGRLIFRGRDAVHGTEPWITDGTTAGTRMIADLNPRLWSFPEARAVADGKLFFRASSGTTDALWTLDGSTLELRRLLTFTPWQDRGAAFNGGMVFTLDDMSHGAELWWTDGTPEGTRPIVDLYPGPADGVATQGISSQAHRLHTTSRGVLFIGNDGRHGEELWITDGTAAGTRLLKDIHPGVITELDTDGVPAVTENGAPNDGDGDRDGTRDSESSLTASMRARSRDYIIVRASCPMQQARLINPSSVTPQAGHVAQDIVEFQLQCASADVTILYTFAESDAGTRYLTYAPLLPGTAGWFTFNAATMTAPPSFFGPTTVRMSLTDGGIGDDSRPGDGMIVHRGVIARPFSGARNRGVRK